MVIDKKPQQKAFTIIELVITLAIATILIMMVTPVIRSSISEHRALNMVAAIKTDLEWARNQALSTNQKYQFKLEDLKTCKWIASASATSTSAKTGISHQMTKKDLDNYLGVNCQFKVKNKQPIFNGLGMNDQGDFSVDVSAEATTRKWTITLNTLGSVKVTVQ